MEWQDQTRIPRGMSDFGRWYRPPGIDKRKYPADIDGILHTLNGNKFLMLEFKPAGKDLSTGQRITLESFSKLPNCTSIVVYDPYWNDETREEYADDQALTITIFRKGEQDTKIYTVEEFNQAIARWFTER